MRFFENSSQTLRMHPLSASTLALGLALGAGPAMAQPTAEADTDRLGSEAHLASGDDIIVIAEKSRGQVVTSQPPIQVLNTEDIAAYGVSSVADLVDALAPQASSARGRSGGRPVFLVNGLRVSSFREFRSYPPEAIEKVEVLPEEVAQRYGFPADQRVLNFIMKGNFSSREIEVEYGQPDRGGYRDIEAELTYLRLNGPSRLNLNLEINDGSSLTEAERGVIQSGDSVPGVATDPNPADYRTLVADTASYEATANWTTALGASGASLSLNGTAERSDSLSLSGLDSVVLTSPESISALRTFNADDPLEVRRRSTTFSLGSTLNAPVGDWQLTGTLDASHARGESWIDQNADASALVAAAAAGTLPVDAELPAVAPGGLDEAETVTRNAEAKFTLMGQPLFLPAGDLAVTLDGGYDWLRTNNRDTRNPGQETQLTRGTLNGGANLAIPLTSRDLGVMGWAGDLTLNISGGVDHLSDFGTMTDWTAGVVWGWTDRLNIQASYITRQAAPGLASLGDPEVVTPNVSVYDFTTGETSLVSVISGGNPDLRREKQRDLRLAAFWEMPVLNDATLSVEYNRNRSEDVTAGFPLLTEAVEAVFADRVVRDSSGRLLSIDQRPVTFAGQNSARLSFGLNMSGSVGKAREEKRESQAGAAPAAGPRIPGRGGNGQGRWFLNMTYTLELENEVLIAEGVPVFDQLAGDAIASSGVSRHSGRMVGGVFHGGFGLRASGNYTGPSRINATGAAGSSDLYFGSLATLDLRLFANLGEQEKLVKSMPWLKGTRVSLEVDNVFDSRRTVTNGDGAVPISYQPFRLDPTGRYIGVEFRKVF